MDPNQHPIVTAILTTVFNVALLGAILFWFRKRLETYIDSYLGEKGRILARIEQMSDLANEVHDLAKAGEKGKNLARSEDIEKLVAEVRALTKTSEDIKAELQARFSRISKVHEREFEILPKAWFMLHMAVGAAHAAVIGIAYIKLVEMPVDEYEDLIEKSGLADYQKKRLLPLKGIDRFNSYYDERSTASSREAAEDHRIFSNYLIEHRIFMSAPLHTAFLRFANQLQTGLTEYSMGKDTKSEVMIEDGKKKIVDLYEEMPGLEKMVQERLRFEEA